MCRQDGPARPCRIVSAPGLPRRRLGKLIAELAGPWLAQQESRLRERRGGDRLRAEGAGPGRELVFTDRVIATLVILRFQLPHAALALFYGVDRSTITRAVQEIRPLLAARGFAVPGQPGLRLRTLADVFAYAAAEGVHAAHRRHRGAGPPARGEPARPPGVRVRQEEAEHRSSPPPSATAQAGCCGSGRSGPGRMHDVTALRTEGIEDLLRRYPEVKADVDSGYQGLARDFPGQVTAPPKKPDKDAPPGQIAGWEAARKAQSSQRICVEHAIAEPKQWRTLQRYIGRREYFDDTALAIAGLVSDRAARR